jgi:uroporphyrinogen decarboxylase
MDPARLKQEFGDRLGFWGASADPQSTLVRGTPAEVAAEAERHLSIFSPGGGYVFASIHNVQADVPADNVVALYDAALAFRPASMEMP